MRANRLRTLWIMFLSVFWVLEVSVKAVFQACLGRLDRKRVNRYMRQWARRMLRAVKATFTVYHSERLLFKPNRPYMLMVNHCSHYDIPLSLLAVQGNVRMLAKKELFKIPVYGRALREGEFISIDRENRQQAMADMQRAKQKLIDGIVLWVAPEGTRSSTGKLGPLKAGGFLIAIETGAQIIPIGIRGSQRILPTKTWQFSTNEHIELYVGDTIDANQYTIRERKKLMSVVRSSLQQLTGETP